VLPPEPRRASKPFAGNSEAEGVCPMFSLQRVPMAKPAIVKRIPLRPFRIDIRDKARVRALLTKLEVDVFGWNVAELLAKYHYQLDRKLSEEYHSERLLRLVAILVAGDNDDLINNPDAILDDTMIHERMFEAFTLQFLCGLKEIVCEPGQLKDELLDPHYSYSEGVYGR
jgi:hypothetical protein